MVLDPLESYRGNMCDPVTGAAIASVVIGTAMKKQSADDAASKARGFTRDEMGRQSGYEAAARGKQNVALNKYGKGNIQSEMRGENKRITDLLNKNVGGQVAQAPVMRGGSPNVIKGIEEAAMNRAKDRAVSRGESMGNLGAFGQALTNVAPSLMRAREQGRMSGNFMRGSANALNRELGQARAEAYSPLGDLLQNLGMVGANYGLKKKPDDPEVVQS